MAESAGDRHREPSQGAAASGAAFRALRAAGVVIAWICAVACGWNVGRQSDLLDAVLHGAMAWAGVIGIWLGALAILRRSLGHGAAGAARDPESSGSEVGPTASA